MNPGVKIAGYEFSAGARFQKGAVQDADAVGKHLEFLRKQHRNELTPSDVVADARGHNSPLHSFFEWDDAKGAEAHRLSQARGLIRCVVAIYVSPSAKAKRVRAFVHINEAGAQHYRSTDHAMSQERTRNMILRQAWREFKSWRQRYRELDEFATLFERADKIAGWFTFKDE